MSDTISIEEARKTINTMSVDEYFDELISSVRQDYASQHDMTVEELYDVISDEIDSVYEQPSCRQHIPRQRIE